MKRRYAWYRVAFLMTLVCAFVLLSACSSPESANNGGGSSTGGSSVNNESATDKSSGASGEMPTIRVAYMPDMHGATPLVIAEEKGYFKEEGIKVNPVKFLSGPPEFQAMAAGDIDIAYIGPGATFLSAQGQGHILTIDSLNTGDMVLATKKSGIGSVKDLKGKTVGVPKGTSGEMVLNLALEKAGIKPEEVNIVNMDVAGTVAAFVANKVDAVAIWSPYTFEIEKQIGKENVIKLADNTDFFPEYVFPQSWVVNPTFLEKNKDLVVKFVRAWAKANDYRLNNMDEAVKMTSAFTQVPEDSLKIQVETTKWLTSEEIKKYFQDGTAKQWYENLEKLFVKNGKLKEIVNGDEFIRPEPLYEALK